MSVILLHFDIFVLKNLYFLENKIRSSRRGYAAVHGKYRLASSLSPKCIDDLINTSFMFLSLSLSF